MRCDGCVLVITRADNFNRKFGLRTMKSLRKTVLTAATLLLAASFAAMQAQQPRQDAPPPAPQGTPQARIRIPVDQVIVPVTVKDSSGRLVADLRRDEFRIFEDNVEQRIASFQADVIPLSDRKSTRLNSSHSQIS